MYKIGRFFSGIFIVSAFFVQTGAFGMTKEKLTKRLAGKRELLGSLQKDANRLLLEKKFFDSAREALEAARASFYAKKQLLEYVQTEKGLPLGYFLLEQKSVLCFENIPKKDIEAFEKLQQLFVPKTPAQIVLFLQNPDILQLDFCMKHAQLIEKLLGDSTSVDIKEIGYLAKNLSFIGAMNKEVEGKITNIVLFAAKGFKDPDLLALLQECFVEGAVLRKMIRFFDVILESFSSNKEINTLDSFIKIEKEIKNYDDFSSISTDYSDTIKKIKDNLKGVSGSPFLKKFGSTETLPDSLLPNSMCPETSSTITSSSSQKKKTKQKSKQFQQKKLSKDEKEPSIEEMVKEPVVSSSSSASLVSTALKLPSLPTCDGSKIVGDNQYYITIKDQNGNKYLFYEPEAGKKITFDKFEFSYHERVKKYFDDPDQAIKEDFRFSSIDNAETLKKIKLLKVFPHAADWLIKSLGITGEHSDAYGKTVPNVTLMGQIQQKNGEVINCVFQWGFDPKNNNLCYHRSGTERVPEAMIKEYQNRKFNVDFPPLPST